jgi:hypothetical protein
MPQVLGLEVANVLQEVQVGLDAAQAQLGTAQLPFTLDSVDLELKVVWTLDEEGKPKFKVPVLGWEIGSDIKAAEALTQTIKVSLTPVPAGVERMGPPVSRVLADALVQAARIVSQARVLGLTGDTASVSLELAVTASGEVEVLVVSASVEHAVTSTLTVSLKAA